MMQPTISNGLNGLNRPAARMDRMYQYTRHIYDVTRAYYLLGRNQLLREISHEGAGSVLEVGCGTARNLRRLRGMAPHLALYGLDASQKMLATAQRKTRPSMEGRLCLRQGLAETWSPRATFGRSGPFQVIFFSYVLSMLTRPERALTRARRFLARSGRLYIVDFWDQRSWPSPLARALQGWLGLFGVRHRPSVHAFLQNCGAQPHVRLTKHSIGNRYAYRACLYRQPEFGAIR